MRLNGSKSSASNENSIVDSEETRDNTSMISWVILENLLLYVSNHFGMKHLTIFILLSCCISATAQINRKRFPAFFRMNPSFPVTKWKSSPRLNTIITGSNSSSAYWEGTSYTSYSENGRLRATHSFDIQGQLRESRTYLSLRKTGALSNWSIQIIPQRNRPLFVYRIQ
jgi:hypothetical protein